MLCTLLNVRNSASYVVTYSSYMLNAYGVKKQIYSYNTAKGLVAKKHLWPDLGKSASHAQR